MPIGTLVQTIAIEIDRLFLMTIQLDGGILSLHNYSILPLSYVCTATTVIIDIAHPDALSHLTTALDKAAYHAGINIESKGACCSL